MNSSLRRDRLRGRLAGAQPGPASRASSTSARGRSWLALLLPLLGGSLLAQAQSHWQLTFHYDSSGLFLDRAAPIAPTIKNIRTPGLGGAPLQLDRELEWLDAKGRALIRVPVTLPLGTRRVLDPTGPTPGDGGTVPPEGAFTLRVPGPPQSAGVRALRLVGDRAKAGSLPAAPIPRAFTAPEIVLDLPKLAGALEKGSPPGLVSSAKVRDTGPDANRLVIVIMSDGYTEPELTSGAFSNQVSRFLNGFLAQGPWSTCGAAVNVYRLDLLSNESGADYEDAPPGAGGTTKDTYLDAHFWSGGLERALALSSPGLTRAYAAADAVVGPGLWDEILVFANSTKYGGSGGAVGVSSIESRSPEILVHELGHSFAYLADEYDYGSAGTTCSETITPNLDCGFQFPRVKWDVWITPGTPLPTPETSRYAGVVGAFEGALYQASGVYRPMLQCKMQSLGAPFCPICQEAHVLQLFERIHLLDATRPPAGPVDVVADTVREFSVTALPVPGVGYQWSLGGLPLTGETNASLALPSTAVTSSNLELSVEAVLSTPLVRARPILNGAAWQLRPVALPALTLAGSTIAEGDAGVASLVLQATLSSPSPVPVTVDYATADGTATAGVDYLPTSGQLVFTPGETTREIVVQILGDLAAEPDEDLLLQLSSPQHVTLLTDQASAVIADNDRPPVVSLTSPPDAATFWQGENVPIVVEATDPDGSITSLAVLDNGAVLTNLTAGPFSILWTNAPPGTHLLVAAATDNSGRTASSAPVRVTVFEGRLRHLPLIPLTNAWRYDATTNDYGSAWTGAVFDDAAWPGPSNAVFYTTLNLPGAGPRNTRLPLTNNGARIRAFYFRTHFVFPEPPTPGLTLIASNLVDDGAIFYLNGAESGRLRMPDGPIARTNFALPGPLATAFGVLPLGSDTLVQGDNVLAVEVHVDSDTTPVATFGMYLEAIVLPPLRITAQPQSQVVNLGADATFSVLAGGEPPPSYQWWFNGTNAIPWGTSNTLTLTNVQDLDAGYYSVVVNNGVAATSSNALLTVNHLPVPASPRFERLAGQGVKSHVSEFVGTDPDGDLLSLVSAGPATALGGDVALFEDWVFYTPPPGNTNADSFSFSVSDGRGGVASGTAVVIVRFDAALTQNIQAETMGDGSVWLRCEGMPGRSYAIEFTEALTAPAWQRLTVLVADPTGAFEFVDHPPPGSPQRFYRTSPP